MQQEKEFCDWLLKINYRLSYDKPGSMITEGGQLISIDKAIERYKKQMATLRYGEVASESSVFVGVFWASNLMAHFCLVLIYNQLENKLKAYLDTVPGNNRIEDMKQAYAWGAKFPVKETIDIIKKMGEIILPYADEIFKTAEYA